MPLIKKSFRIRVLIISITLLLGSIQTASPATYDAVSHIHHLKVVGDKILVATHEGLYQLVAKNKMTLIGKEKIDVMGLASLGNTLYASGHPAMDSKMPNPIGLIKSSDGGASWAAVSLVGKVDFHSLEGAKTELYGVDSQSGKLMYSQDSGKEWKSLGTNSFEDIAVSPNNAGVAIAIKGKGLILTKNAFGKSSKVRTSFAPTQIEWSKSGLFALSASTLFKSTNEGKSWSKLSTFKGSAELLSASDEMIIVTVGREIYASQGSGILFKKPL
jgi:photosystem II stability/assembly factor-like uncharacterized protein